MGFEVVLLDEAGFDDRAAGLDGDVACAGDTTEERLRATIAGARAGRGFRYQDAVAASFAVLSYVAAEPWSVLPEGAEDITLTVRESEAHEVQAKSRRAQARAFTAVDAMRLLAETWARHIDRLPGEDVRVSLVVDRDPVGAIAAGFAADLAAQPDLPVKQIAKVAATAGLSASDLLRRSHLFLSTSPAAFATGQLVDRLGVVPMAAEVIYRQVLSRVADLADDRAAGRSPSPITPNEVARIIEEGQRIVDLESIERPIRDGLCEYVNFEHPIRDSAFYLGVDVVAGHIAAGLVADRPDEVDQVLVTLERAGQAVVTGPSGIGKTAVAYLAADATKHTIRWLRVRDAATAFEILKLTEALRATASAPVGLLLDDIGRTGAPLWDDLARRARDHEGVVLLGTTREEDLDLLEEAAESTVLRPRLDDSLARPLWEHLTASGATAAPSWVEALDESDGLTLEFVHYLTTGDRLPETINRQVQVRRNEHRDDELRLLRVVSIAARSGAAIDLRRFASKYDRSDEDVQRALCRLVDEHLVRSVGPNELTGLHRLRSAALLEATHRTPPPSLAETATTTIECVVARDLAQLLMDLWVGDLIGISSMREGLTERLQSSPSALDLASCLEGLRAVSVGEYSLRANEILTEHDVPSALRHTAASLAMASDRDVDDLFTPSVAHALVDLRQLTVGELRSEWIDCLSADLIEASTKPGTADQGTLLLQALAGLSSYQGLAKDIVRNTPAPSEVRQIAEFIEGGRLVAPAVADACVAAVGGRASTIELARSQPWVARLDIRDAGVDAANSEHVVEFDLMCVEGGLEQDQIHDAVVDLTRLYFGLFPDVDVVGGKAIDAAGELVGYRGHHVADKRIPRVNMPSPAEVRWNRQILNAFAEAGSESRAERLVTEAELLRRTCEVVGPVAQRWVRRTEMTPAQRAELSRISEQTDTVWRRERKPNDPLDSGEEQVDVGSLAAVLKSLCGNALPRLFSDPSMGLAAFLLETVHGGLMRTVDVGYWRLLDEDHDEEVLSLAQSVLDLHQVLGLRLHSDRATSAVRAAQRAGAPLADVAKAARDAHEVAFVATITAFTSEARAAGLTSTAFRLEPEKVQSLIWPHNDVVIAIAVASLYEWMQSIEVLLEVATRVFETMRSVTLVPYRDGSIVPSMAVRTLSSSDGVPYPGLEQAGRLGDEHGFRSITGRITPAFTRAAALEATTVGLDRLNAHRSLDHVEAALNVAVQAELDELLDCVRSQVEEDGSGLLGDLIGEFFFAAGDDDLASVLSAIARGDADDALGLLGLLNAVEIELSLDPAAAAEGLQSWIAASNAEASADPAIARQMPSTEIRKVGRNDHCPCGSGNKFKRCHG